MRHYFHFLIFISPLNAQGSIDFSIPEEIIVKSTRSEAVFTNWAVQ